MTLTEQLQSRKQASATKYPADKRAIMRDATQALRDEKLSAKALGVGQKVPEFQLPDEKGEQVAITDWLKKGKVVLSFYRGGWCPYCNLELRALQGILDELKANNTQLIAISPELPDHTLTTSEKNELSFPVLSDVGNTVAKEFGLVFQMPKALRDVYLEIGIDLPVYNGDREYELPMPATYIIDQDGVVEYAFVPEDYTERLDPEDILRIVKAN